MAARFKKRPPGSANNKNIKLDMLTLYDLMCPICQSIYIEPVTLPCFHNFCLNCFNRSVENNALACPLCRTRIGSWLRKTSKQNKLVDTKLWEYIKKNFENEVNAKLNDGEVTMIQDESVRKLSVVGEIQQEYQKEVDRFRREQQAISEKQAKESEKLIRELQEQERLQREEREAKLRRDEELARQLAQDSQALLPSSGVSGGKGVIGEGGKQRHFYEYQAGKTSNTSNNTLDRYVVKKNSNTNVGNGNASYMESSPPSPELISTAGRCGRFLKNFLTVRLWGSNITTHHPTHGKHEPKVWEPQDTCSGHSRELTVNTGVEQHHHTPNTSYSNTTKDGVGRYNKAAANLDDSISQEIMVTPDTVSRDSLAQELCYFKPLHPEPNMFPGKWMRCIPMRPSTLTQTKSPSSNGSSSDSGAPNIVAVLKGLEILKGGHFWRKSPVKAASSFVCMVQVPLQIIKARESPKSSCDKSPTSSAVPSSKPNKKTINRNKKQSPVDEDVTWSPTTNGGKGYTTPKKNGKKPSPIGVNSKKSSPYGENGDRRACKRRRISNDSSCKESSPRKQHPMSKSCVKLGSNGYNPDDHVLTRSKRSISFGDVPNGSLDHGAHAVGRTLRSNGLITKQCDSIIKLSNDGRKMSLNDNVNHRRVATTNNNNNYKKGINGIVNGDNIIFDSSILEEQKRIEEMIKQEKKDYALAKKLQRQFCGGDYISTGYTLRTAAKKQATLRDIFPVAKKMKV